ncbi:ATP-dependent DNA helicase RecG [Propionispora sp. 2/2-37]|uniref:ATP-dependent DNA helicase RecG n=1 Tax=Propionispora sp. 2/2-37 TaxID=1677858 RepID=UPI0006BB7439|nr:ATP-dependent DNA helicase RecG [Propionispora sp. 2/2-37]CUH94232.1 ATP-dependent DNA helicase RecG [Propionispora sp. 2/2-37]
MTIYKSTNVQYLKGVGNQKAAWLANLGILTIQDLLEHFPRRYEDRRQIKAINQLTNGEMETFIATIIGSNGKKSARGVNLTKIMVRDHTGIAELIFFNQPYLKTKYKLEEQIMVYGKIQKKIPYTQVVNPEMEIIGNTGFLASGSILPIYSCSDNISQRWLRGLLKQALSYLNTSEAEILPAEVIKDNHLIGHNEALLNIHFPADWEILKKSRERLVFEELYLLQCGLLYSKRRNRGSLSGIKHASDGHLVRQLEQNLPFSLTHDQRQTLLEVKADMENTVVMQRMVQGDVGSGKTVVAAIALAKTVENGYQGALMVPTEILAEQHYRTLSELLSVYGVRIALLTGKLSKYKRQQLINDIGEGVVDIVIGTHALIQEDVFFKALGLVITDEQHRFGVRQRAKLQSKGKMPDVLVMTATPIPRTMALTVYGDLDVSSIKQLPPGRSPVKTFVRDSSRRSLVYKFIIDEVTKGHQAYIVCPLVEESEKIQAQSAVKLYSELKQSFFRDISCGLVHGKMKMTNKEKVMADFYQQKIKILISTTVIEVGVNVPNATVMVIEGADRFGLAQLHQLRGRIGRGKYQSYCILLSDNKNTESRERMKIMTQISDGFQLAEQDLIMRGPGHFFGEQQHGLPDLKIADILQDVDLLLKARKAAQQTVNSKDMEKIVPVIAARFSNHFDIMLQS